MYLKKSLGQHFLKDKNVQMQIAAAIGDLKAFARVIEIGPGMGALTQHLVKDKPDNLYLIELDDRWAEYQKTNNAFMADRVIHKDFLKTDLTEILEYPTHIVGNFPYNISTEIVFTIIDHKDMITQMTGMFQKEVALRLAAKPRTKDYGVTSVLTQAYYEATYLFDVQPEAFDPPPKVMSGVLRLVRRKDKLGCDEKLFKKVVKQAFTMRRKTMRNSLKQMIHEKNISDDTVFNKRPEELDVAGFVALTKMIFTLNESTDH
ncbi:MAG: Ribosomal small subunit methyltransferase [Bacteroidetes bacterium]|nr:Ribosomal small subunit methyltransferase [Bacteroidota bacterium]